MQQEQSRDFARSIKVASGASQDPEIAAPTAPRQVLASNDDNTGYQFGPVTLDDIADAASNAATASAAADDAATSAAEAAASAASVGQGEGGVIDLSGGGAIQQVIPAGVQKITILFRGASKSTATPMTVNVGVGGVSVASGYSMGASELSGAALTSATASSSFQIERNGAADAFNGKMEIERVGRGRNIWVQSHIGENDGGVSVGGGGVTLAGELDLITFDSLCDAGEAVVKWTF